MRKVFERIYDLHHWYDPESKSGPGSSLRQTETVRNVVTSLLKSPDINTILDIPCGDFNWMKEVDLASCHYIGADIVDPLVQENQRRYSDDRRMFIWADITSTQLPKADMVICRDCFVHLSYSDISLAIHNLRRSGSTYLLTTTFTAQSNRDIATGRWRPVNLQAFPFCFPSPLQLFNENCTESDGLYVDKSLGLWHIETLPLYLAS